MSGCGDARRGDRAAVVGREPADRSGLLPPLQLETELKIARRAAELLKDAKPPKRAVRGNRDGMTDFAVRYADQNERDYDAFVDAIHEGRLEATEGV